MNDLISRNALLEIFDHDLACFETNGKTEKEMYISVADMRKMIKEQPTAYNVEKVVQEIEEEIQEYERLEKGSNFESYHQEVIKYEAKIEAFKELIEIVRNGGKE